MIRSTSILIIALLFGLNSFATEKGEKKPNILVVLIDDCSADELSCYGNGRTLWVQQLYSGRNYLDLKRFNCGNYVARVQLTNEVISEIFSIVR